MCREIKGINANADVGEYLGFKLNITFETFNNRFILNAKGALSHQMELGSDPLGNITRINNLLEAMPLQLDESKTKLANTQKQLETAKTEVTKPFPQEAELNEKLEKLARLNALLNMDEKGNETVTIDDEEPATDKPKPRPSLIGRLAEKKAIVASTSQGRDEQGIDKRQDKTI
jgi:small-conductance mechanosensitive channel